MALVEIERVSHEGAAKETASRDWLRAIEATATIVRNPQRTLLNAIEDIARDAGEVDALISGRGTLTYRALTERANRYARWALAQNLGKGDTVCLMMPNRPEYLA